MGCPASTGSGEPQKLVSRKYITDTPSFVCPQTWLAETSSWSRARSVRCCQPSPRWAQPEMFRVRSLLTCVPTFIWPYHWSNWPQPPTRALPQTSPAPRACPLVKIWIMPANADTPYRVPCGPRVISIRSMFSIGTWARFGLNGPPTGTPSTMTMRASNSLMPKRPMFGRRGPLSEPSPVSRPTMSWRACASVVVPRARSSLPETTVMSPGMSMGSWAIFVAETTTSSLTGSTCVAAAGVGTGVGDGVGDGADCAHRERAPTAPKQTNQAPAMRRRELHFIESSFLRKRLRSEGRGKEGL